MTSNHSHTLTREPLDDVSVQMALSSAAHEPRGASGVSATEMQEAKPRIAKVMAMRRKLREGRYKVSIPELADALFACAAIPSK